MADSFLKEFDLQRGPAGIHTIRADFLRCQLMSRSLPKEDEERKMELERDENLKRRNGATGGRVRSRSKTGKGGGGMNGNGENENEILFNPLKMNKRRLNALRISRQVEAMKMLERALNAAKRSDDVDVLHEGELGGVGCWVLEMISIFFDFFFFLLLLLKCL